MQRSELIVLVDYLYWLRDRIVEAAAELPAGAFTASETVTTRDLRATLVHELDVEWSWRERLRSGRFPDADDLDPKAYPDLDALVDHWRRDEDEMRAWLDGLTDEQLSAPSPSERRSLPLWYFVMHLVTHGIQQLSEAAVQLTHDGQSPGEIGFLEFVKDRVRSGAEG